MAEIKREQTVYITLKKREELLALVAALASMSRNDYQVKIEENSWENADAEGVKEAGSKLYVALARIV